LTSFNSFDIIDVFQTTPYDRLILSNSTTMAIPDVEMFARRLLAIWF